jgi:hypothetical protein
MGVVRGRLGTGLDVPLIYLKWYGRLNNQQSNQINISFVPLLFVIGVDSNIAFTLIFTSLVGILDGLQILRQTVGSLLPDGVLSGGQNQGLLANAAASAHMRIV